MVTTRLTSGKFLHLTGVPDRHQEVINTYHNSARNQSSIMAVGMPDDYPSCVMGKVRVLKDSLVQFYEREYDYNGVRVRDTYVVTTCGMNHVVEESVDEIEAQLIALSTDAVPSQSPV